MALVSYPMSMREESEPRRQAAVAPAADFAGVAWNDSSWDLKHGLDVVEDLPPDAWPQDGLLAQKSFA